MPTKRAKRWDEARALADRIIAEVPGILASYSRIYKYQSTSFSGLSLVGWFGKPIGEIRRALHLLNREGKILQTRNFTSKSWSSVTRGARRVWRLANPPVPDEPTEACLPSSTMKRRSGEAQAALGRRAPVMKHRLAGRGGSRNEQMDLMEEALQEHGLQQPFQDSATLVEDCGPGCTHRDEASCALPSTGFNPTECPHLGIECTSTTKIDRRRFDHSECAKKAAEIEVCYEQDYDCVLCQMYHPCDCMLPWNRYDAWDDWEVE